MSHLTTKETTLFVTAPAVARPIACDQSLKPHIRNERLKNYPHIDQMEQKVRIW